MTSNQVNWVNAMENRRSNVANEEIKRDANAISAQHYARQDQETQRSNMAQEALKQEANNITRGYYAATTAETYRSNVARETEANRSNLANEAINRQNANTNKANALVNARNAAVNERNATVNERNATTNARNATVNERNASTNALNAQTNIKAQKETVRSNKANEKIKRKSNTIQETYNTGMLGYTGVRVSNETALASLDAKIKAKEKNKIQADIENVHTKTATERTVPALNEAKTKESRSKKIQNYINGAGTILDSLSKFLPALSGVGGLQ